MSLGPDTRFEMFKFLSDFTEELARELGGRPINFSEHELMESFGPVVTKKLNVIQFRKVVCDTIHKYSKLWRY